jgi:hypothetical protein
MYPLSGLPDLPIEVIIVGIDLGLTGTGTRTYPFQSGVRRWFGGRGTPTGWQPASEGDYPPGPALVHRYQGIKFWFSAAPS